MLTFCLHTKRGTRDLHAAKVLEVERLQQVPGVGVDLNELLLQSTNLRHKVHPALALLLLQLEGDVANGAALDALHEVRGEAGDLVTHALGGDDRNLVADALISVEVEGEARVVLLDNGAGGLLDGLGADAHG